MRRLFDLSDLRRTLVKGLSGPQMLAFLPALCLSAYWVGGEVVLVLCALATPLAYALLGGFGRWADATHDDRPAVPDRMKVAQDFLAIAQHNGQTTACFQICVPDLEQIAKQCGASAAADARDLVADRLRTTLRGGDHVFRCGDTKFTILVAPGFRLRLDTLFDIGKRLREAAEMPVVLAGTTHPLSASIGIASSLNFGRNVTAETWLQSATEAMEDAVMTGPGTTRLWSDRLGRRHRSRHALQQDIMAALDDGSIQAYFQPQISIRTGEVIGMEAFARWHHPTRGLMPAADFLPSATEAHQMSRLGRTILLQAITALRAWDDARFDIATISVNLSEDELRDPDLINRIADDLERCGLPAHRLVLDIPDSISALSGDDVIRRNLMSFADLGCGLDLEGFGMGGCNIAMVQRLPISRLKLDKMLVQGGQDSEDGRRALDAVLSIADRLDLPAIAAGVETVEQEGVLRDLGCAQAQGFLYAKPSSAADMTVWLENRRSSEVPPSTTQIRRIR